jgi:predicted nucleotidyltransferase
VTKEQAKILKTIDEEFVPLSKEILGASLASVILYGSAVKGQFSDGISDVNLLILITDDHSDSVITFGKKAARLIRKNRMSPLIMTVDGFINSADVFPMEYLDIRSSRKVIYGSDVTEQLEITKANLRHQVEEQLRGSITSMRSALLHGKGKARTSKLFLKEWFGAQNALFRGLLRLKGEEKIPQAPEALAGALGNAFGVSTDILLDITRLRNGEKLDPVSAVKGLLLLLTDLVGSVDSMEA